MKSLDNSNYFDRPLLVRVIGILLHYLYKRFREEIKESIQTSNIDTLDVTIEFTVVKEYSCLLVNAFYKSIACLWKRINNEALGHVTWSIHLTLDWLILFGKRIIIEALGHVTWLLLKVTSDWLILSVKGNYPWDSGACHMINPPYSWLVNIVCERELSMR